jgi:hypothetical protein
MASPFRNTFDSPSYQLRCSVQSAEMAVLKQIKTCFTTLDATAVTVDSAHCRNWEERLKGTTCQVYGRRRTLSDGWSGCSNEQLHTNKSLFVLSASLQIYTVSPCTIRFQNAPLPKGRAAISVTCAYGRTRTRVGVGTNRATDTDRVASGPKYSVT